MSSENIQFFPKEVYPRDRMLSPFQLTSTFKRKNWQSHVSTPMYYCLECTLLTLFVSNLAMCVLNLNVYNPLTDQ